MEEDRSFAEIFCARNYNEFGRYTSLTNLRGKRKSVLIILEMTFNSAWVVVAEKMARFINGHKMKNVIEEYRIIDSNTPYAELARSFKWANRDGKDSNGDVTVENGGVISIKDSLITQNEVLKRSLVGEFNASEVRRWASSLWKQANNLNIYEMGNGSFLFKFNSRMIQNRSWRGIRTGQKL